MIGPVVHAADERIRPLEADLESYAEQSPRLNLILALQVLRGIAFLSAVIVVLHESGFDEAGRPYRIRDDLVDGRGVCQRDHLDRPCNR